LSSGIFPPPFPPFRHCETILTQSGGEAIRIGALPTLIVYGNLSPYPLPFCIKGRGKNKKEGLASFRVNL
jgi:hypothetical protein